MAHFDSKQALKTRIRILESEVRSSNFNIYIPSSNTFHGSSSMKRHNEISTLENEMVYYSHKITSNQVNEPQYTKFSLQQKKIAMRPYN